MILGVLWCLTSLMIWHTNDDEQWRSSVINLRGPGHLSPSFNPAFFPSLSWTLHGVWTEPAHPLPNNLMKFIQSNSLIKSTLMFNVLQKSACMQSSVTVARTYSIMALKVGARAHLYPPLTESERSGPQDPYRITATRSSCSPNKIIVGATSTSCCPFAL